MSEDITARLIRLITEEILGDGARRPVTAKTPLLSHGLDLDSVAVLQLIMGIEVEFGVRFEDGDLSVDLFRTPATLAEAVIRKIEARTGTSPHG